MAKVKTKRESVKLKVKDESDPQAVKVSSEKAFIKLCKKLTKSFRGLMRLWGEVEDQTFSGGLFVEDGLVVACSFEHLDEAQVSYGEDALLELKSTFSGVDGELDIFILSDNDFESALELNSYALLEDPVKLTSLGIKIKSHFKKKNLNKKQGFFGRIFGSKTGGDSRGKKKAKRKIRKIKVEEDFDISDFARNIKGLDPVKAKRFLQLRKKLQIKRPDGGLLDERKKNRFREIRKKQAKLRMKTKKDVFGDTPKVQPSSKDEKDRKLIEEDEGFKPREGRQVTTSIDELYKIIKEKKELRITEELAKKLRVPKTQIEEWAMILEEHELLEIKYPTIGEPVILSKDDNKDGGS